MPYEPSISKSQVAQRTIWPRILCHAHGPTAQLHAGRRPMDTKAPQKATSRKTVEAHGQQGLFLLPPAFCSHLRLRRPRRRRVHGPVDWSSPRSSLARRASLPSRCLARPLARQNARREAKNPFPLSAAHTSLSPPQPELSDGTRFHAPTRSSSRATASAAPASR